MKRIRHHQRTFITCLLGLVAALVCAGTGLAQVNGIIQDRTGAVHKGRIRYKKLSRMYVVEIKSRSGTMVSEVKFDDVRRMQIQKPADLDKLIKDVRLGRHSSAIGGLEAIAAKYEYLEHDVTASRWLMECYMKANRVPDAIRMGEKVMKNNPDSITAEFFSKYADALLAGKRNSELRAMIVKAISSGNREAAAVAQIKRGDMDMQAGRYKDALREGYLRTVLLFQDIKSARPEALYKAHKCFAEIGQQGYAEKMRKKLLSEFPGHHYTTQLGSK